MDKLGRCERLLRAYRTLTRVSAALDTAASEAELLAEVCRIAVEDAGYRLAWVGYVDTDAARPVRPVADCGFDEGYLASLKLTWADEPRGRGPTGTAIRTGETSVAQNIPTDPRFEPWRAEALQRGYASSAALPLRHDGHVFGALSLYAAEPGAFDADELELLDRVAKDLARGIHCARGQLELGRMERVYQRADRFELAARVAATIAHDVNNCLAVVLPCLDRLKEHAAAADARTAIERAVALNRRLLTLSREPAKSAPMSVDTFLRALQPSLERLLAPSRLSLELGADPWQVGLPEQELDQIITNLALNARDAITSAGEITIRTTRLVLSYPIGAPYLGVSAGEYVDVRVSDTGSGIPADVRERLFEPFFTTKGEQGTGLGLASVLGIARRCGGNVFVESEVGKGTAFEVLLPRATAQG